MNRILLFFASLFLWASATAAEPVDSKYLSGAVPMENGKVVFRKDYVVPGASADSLYRLLRTYVDADLVNGPEHGQQARIIVDDATSHAISASIQETLWFLRRPMRSDFAQYFYKIDIQVTDGAFSVAILPQYYLYDVTERTEDIKVYRAEEWITDKEALAKNGTKLARVSGKFRRATIDRKEEVFYNCGVLTGAQTRKVIIREEY